jgi:hypothetical protein
MTKPIRLQLSRRKGFDLQRISVGFNGLPAVNVSRPGFWGNPFIVTNKIAAGKHVAGPRYYAVPTVRDAVECFRLMMAEPNAKAWVDALPELRNKNLACWCKPGEPCHADVLLEIANRPDAAGGMLEKVKEEGSHGT